MSETPFTRPAAPCATGSSREGDPLAEAVRELEQRIEDVVMEVLTLRDHARPRLQQALASPRPTEPSTAWLRPLFAELITLYDELEGVQVRLASVLEQILGRWGVLAFSEAGDEFNAQRQDVIGEVPTNDPALANRVGQRLRKGFTFEDSVLRPELVALYRYSGATE